MGRSATPFTVVRRQNGLLLFCGAKCRLWPIVLQKSAAPRPIAKTGNIRIRRDEFLNQNSLFGLDLEKVFFAPGPKIVLQHYRPITSLAAMQRYFRSWTISGHCADCREAWSLHLVTDRLSAASRPSGFGSLAKFAAMRRALA
jgi:hypothetical protein